MNKKGAVVLLSGGLDSATTAAVAVSEGFNIHCLSFDYGQRHYFELDCAARTAEILGAVSHTVLKIELDRIGGSALTDNGIDVPKSLSDQCTIPVTYVPARNTIFLSFASALAESKDLSDIFIGVNALDYSGYPDCRPEFISAYEKMINLGTKKGVEEGEKMKIHSPLINLSKKDIVLKGIELGVDFRFTHSCYDPDIEGSSCGECESCRIRLKAFADAGLSDPVRYKEKALP